MGIQKQIKSSEISGTSGQKHQKISIISTHPEKSFMYLSILLHVWVFLFEGVVFFNVIPWLHIYAVPRMVATAAETLWCCCSWAISIGTGCVPTGTQWRGPSSLLNWPTSAAMARPLFPWMEDPETLWRNFKSRVILLWIKYHLGMKSLFEKLCSNIVDDDTQEVWKLYICHLLSALSFTAPKSSA